MTFLNELDKDRIESLVLRNAIAIDSHTILRAAIALMRSQSLGCAVIVDHHCRPTGVFTEQSVIRVLVAGASLDTVPVSEFSDPKFYVAKRSDPIRSVWVATIRDGARFVCVTDEDGQLIGVTGQRGVSEYVCDCFARQIAVQRLGSSPWMLQREGA